MAIGMISKDDTRDNKDYPMSGTDGGSAGGPPDDDDEGEFKPLALGAFLLVNHSTHMQ